MSLQFVKASTSDALTLNGISKRAFDSDVQVGAPSAGGPPGYMSVPYHTKMARSNHLYKLTDNGLIVGGIYDDRFLVKPTKSAKTLMPEADLELA